VTCDELWHVIYDFVSGEMVVELHRTVEMHIAGCERCGILVHSYTHTVRVARALPKCGPLPAAVEARLRQAVEPHLSGGEKHG
jgi:hypothetical protein